MNRKALTNSSIESWGGSNLLGVQIFDQDDSFREQPFSY